MSWVKEPFLKYFLDFGMAQWLVCQVDHATFHGQVCPILRCVCRARHNVAHNLWILKLIALVFFFDNLIYDRWCLVTIHFYHLKIHNDQFIWPIFTITWFSDPFSNQVHSHVAIVCHFNKILAALYTQEHAQLFLDQITLNF